MSCGKRSLRPLREAGEGYQDLIQTMRDEGDAALAELKGCAVFSLLKLKIHEIDTIEQALRRIQKGKYGHCIDCGSWISDARLKIIPHAVRCRTCQERWERAHSQRSLASRHSPFLQES
jgi:DnaK suppressor protein